MCPAISNGDLKTALAQYEAGTVLRPWARDPAANTAGAAGTPIQLIGLRLPLAVRIRAIVPGDGLAPVAGERHIAGTGPNAEPVQLSGASTTALTRQPGGNWRIAADTWHPDRPRAGQPPS